MNPKNINDLDPKLREAYEKVMGTTFNPATQTQNANPQAPEDTPQPNAPLMQTAPAEEQMPPVIQTMPVQPPAPVNPTPSTLPSQNPFVPTPEPPPAVFSQTGNMPAQSKSKRSKLLLITFIVGGTVFFAAYAIIWAKVFGLL